MLLHLLLVLNAPVGTSLEGPSLGGAAPVELAPAQDAGPSLDGFEQLATGERRAAARALVRDGDASHLDRALGLLTADPDPEVRRSLVDFVLRADLGAERAAERAAGVAALVRRDPRPDVVRHGIEALGAMRHPSAGDELDALVDALPVPFREEAARKLVGTQRGRDAVLRRVGAVSRGATVPEDVLSPLLSVYGRVLAEREGATITVAEVAPLVVSSRHPSSLVRVGAAIGVDNLVTRCSQLFDVERCERALDALESAGWDPEYLDDRRANIALRLQSEPERALLPARRLARLGATAETPAELRTRLRGRLLEAATFLASNRPDRAQPLLDDAEAITRALTRARMDLRPLADDPSEGRREELVDVARTMALVELYRAIALLRDGVEASDARVVALLSGTVSRLVEAQVVAERFRVDVPCDLDALLDHRLGPRALLVDSTTNPNLSREDALDLLLQLGRGLASVARHEMPGFEPFTDLAGLRENPLDDERRFLRLMNLFHARQERLLREQGSSETSARERQQLRIRWSIREGWLDEAQSEEDAGTPRAEAYDFLLRERNHSQLALALANNLTAEGRHLEARELAQRMEEDLRETGQLWDLLEARIRMSLASTYTDEGRADVAEEVLLGALDILEGLVTRYETARDQARDEGDPGRERMLEGWLRGAQLRVSDCLVSLAVNANVRMKRPDRALGYFERAYEIDQSDFNRALLACYRARAGRHAEARAELREISPTPALYYNIACTYALMGETDLALEFLQREFDENQQSRGGLERQKAWARDDPDLASLHELERFLALTEPAEQGGSSG